ncbi:MAG: transporter substrate-binding domain-containing protein [Pseudodesulfovibrio sp.]|uniref:ABC transporter substrate-binding protein n=1 Tax=Pseudodesulfovibrio indicus TaxID=1716143 RepID=A0A126QRY7_9BACT|nr:transporter substrate-binding domain-containing protein [Pseudodesulfovibrio indicus]AMK12538.1 ABC transporter substrate-binding protein [Pseudodesulfovibrio indicus]TDT90848.1 amino acid ABC transporter substrate-binding protein (PAAT family) [Pseudodesulfovibrio indicus]
MTRPPLFKRSVRCMAVALAVLLLTVTAAWADLLQDIKDKGEITIGTEAAFPPFEFVENGKIVGYSADLLELIMKDLPGVKLNRLDVPWQGILPGLAAGKFDYIVTSVTATKERYDRYALSLPIADATVALLVRKDSDIKTAGDAAGKVVASQTGSAQLKALLGLGEKLAAEGKSFKDVREYVSFDEAYADLAAGRLDAVAQAFPNLADAVKKRPDAFRIITPPFGPAVYFSWAARKDAESKSLADFFDAGLRKLNESGKMKELQMKWFGFEMPVPADALPVPVQ